MMVNKKQGEVKAALVKAKAKVEAEVEGKETKSRRN